MPCTRRSKLRAMTWQQRSATTPGHRRQRDEEKLGTTTETAKLNIFKDTKEQDRTSWCSQGQSGFFTGVRTILAVEDDVVFACAYASALSSC